jgi:enterochelin esterase-like enzyme
VKLASRLPLVSMIWLVASVHGLTGQTPAVGQGTSGQGATLAFGTPTTRDVRSGEVHEYGLTLDAGDLVSGTITVSGVAALVQGVETSGRLIYTSYVSKSDTPRPQRLGFVAPAAGSYRLKLSAFDRFSFGGQVTPGEPVPVIGAAAGSYTLALDAASVASRMDGQQPAAREDYPSARLKRLAQDVQAGRGDALLSFWREVAGKGPIIEEIAGNDRDADVTFLWRELYDTRNVRLGWAAHEDYMSRLSGTDVWYKTVRLRRGTRIEYVISPNDRPANRWATAQLDPLNPRKFPDDPTYRWYSQSVLDMPGAPDEQWALRTPSRRGAIEEKTVTSTLVKEDQIWIYTPPGYSQSTGPYPLVILFDGAAYVSHRFGAAPVTLDNLINDGRIRPAVVCFDPRNRGPNTAGIGATEKFGDALVQELIPMLRASYAISPNPADVIIGGFSAGGRAAAQIALFHPEVFGNVLSQSGGFRESSGGDEPNASARAFLEAPRKPIRFYMEVGRYDNVPAADRPLYELVLDQTNLMGNRHLRDVLRAKGYDVTYREVGGGHDFVHWRAMLADGLMTLLKR